MPYQSSQLKRQGKKRIGGACSSWVAADVTCEGTGDDVTSCLVCAQLRRNLEAAAEVRRQRRERDAAIAAAAAAAAQQAELGSPQ
jgi:hypothetical protein